MGALFLHLKPDEYLKKLYKTKKLVEKTSFSLQADSACRENDVFSTRFFVLSSFFKYSSVSDAEKALPHA